MPDRTCLSSFFCISQTCPQIRLLGANHGRDHSNAGDDKPDTPANQFSVSSPLPPLQRTQLKYRITDGKLNECFAAKDSSSAGIVKAAAKIFLTLEAAKHSKVNDIDKTWTVIDYSPQPQQSVKFRWDLYNGELTDYRIPGARVGSDNYLVVKAQFAMDSNWSFAFNASSSNPLQFSGFES